MIYIYFGIIFIFILLQPKPLFMVTQKGRMINRVRNGVPMAISL